METAALAQHQHSEETRSEMMQATKRVSDSRFLHSLRIQLFCVLPDALSVTPRPLPASSALPLDP